MRALIPIATVVIASVVGVSDQDSIDRLAVIIDADSPVENAGVADRIRKAALGGRGISPAPTYFHLTARGTQEVPDQDSAIGLVRFDFRPPTLAGVSLSFAEASEILRNNEAVRDAVIRRACGGGKVGNCGGAVHAAAIAMIEDTEDTSASKIRYVVSVCRATGARTVILMTAGWPYRDAGRLKLDDAVQELRTLGTHLVVWRLPTAFPYNGIVHDASETLTSRIQGNLIGLRNEEEAARARAQYAAPPPPADTRDMPAPADQPEVAADAGVAVDAGMDGTLRRATRYVARLEGTLASVMWHEHYHQEEHAPIRFGASGTRFMRLVGQRELESELLLLWLARDASWIAVRDVVAVDGVPRSSGERGLRAALDAPSVSVARLKELATENGRFNIGHIVRTFNEPTLALLFLDDHYRGRFAFNRGRQETVDRRRIVTYQFVERSRPTVIQDRRLDVPARGTFDVDDATGEVLRTSLELSNAAGHLQGTMTVRYEPHPNFDILVPVEMREDYASSAGDHITAVATYLRVPSIRNGRSADHAAQMRWAVRA